MVVQEWESGEVSKEYALFDHVLIPEGHFNTIIIILLLI